MKHRPLIAIPPHQRWGHPGLDPDPASCPAARQPTHLLLLVVRCQRQASPQKLIDPPLRRRVGWLWVRAVRALVLRDVGRVRGWVVVAAAVRRLEIRGARGAYRRRRVLQGTVVLLFDAVVAVLLHQALDFQSFGHLRGSEGFVRSEAWL